MFRSQILEENAEIFRNISNQFYQMQMVDEFDLFRSQCNNIGFATLFLIDQTTLMCRQRTN